MKKLNLKIIAVFITTLCLLNSCQKSETREESFNRLEKTYNVKFSTNVLKIATDKKPIQLNSFKELELLIKSDKKAINQKIIIGKKNDNFNKIMDYTYADGEFGGSGGDPFYSGQFDYQNPFLPMITFGVNPHYNFNSTTGTFSNFGVSVTGWSGIYSATLTGTGWNNLGTYHREYHYYVNVTTSIVSQNLPLSYTFSKHYVLTVNKVTGALIGLAEY